MDHKNTIKLSVIIPTYNEVDRIGDTLQQLHEHFKDNLDSYEVIVVDADSPDGTAKQAQKSAGLFKHFNIISAGPKPKKRAVKGKQVKLGMLSAKGEYVMFMDADLATPLKYLSEVENLASTNKPVGICVRDLQKSHTGVRKLVSSFANFLVQLLILPGIKDTQCGFKAFRQDVAKQVFSRQTIVGWGFDMEVLAVARQLGYQIDTINVPDWKDVQHGETDKTKLSGSKFSALKAAIQTFPDLIKIKWGLMSGRYKKPVS
jgi:dolichyl-phosphate beta-glucosyltransferase